MNRMAENRSIAVEKTVIIGVGSNRVAPISVDPKIERIDSFNEVIKKMENKGEFENDLANSEMEE